MEGRLGRRAEDRENLACMLGHLIQPQLLAPSVSHFLFRLPIHPGMLILIIFTPSFILISGGNSNYTTGFCIFRMSDWDPHS